MNHDDSEYRNAREGYSANPLWYPFSVRMSDDPKAKTIWDYGYHWDSYQRVMHERAQFRQEHGRWPEGIGTR